MCLPAVPAAIAATVVSAGGQLYSGLQASANARYKAAIAAQNRQLTLDQQPEAVARGQFEQQRLWRQVGQAYSKQQALQAASGLDVGFGSSADLLGDTMMIGYEDSNTLAGNTTREIHGYDIDAANYEMSRRAARSEATSALISTAFNVGSTLLGGSSRVAELRSTRAGALANFGR